MDNTNPGYNPDATYDDGSCWVGGCMLPSACNYDPNADYLLINMCDFSSCVGCTDPAASNYNPDATVDNNTCMYDGDDDDGSGGISGGGGFGPAGKLPPKPINLSDLMGVPVMPSKDRNDGRQKGDPLDPGKY